MQSLISSSWSGWRTDNIVSNPVGFVRVSTSNDAQLANANPTAFHVFVGSNNVELPANAASVDNDNNTDATKRAIKKAFAALIAKNQKIMKTSDLLQQIPKALENSGIESVGQLAAKLALVPANASVAGVVYKLFSEASLDQEAVELLRKLNVTAGKNHSIAVFMQPSRAMLESITNTNGRWIVLIKPRDLQTLTPLIQSNANVVLCVANGGVSQAHAILDGIDYFNYQPRLSSNSRLDVNELIDQLVNVL